MTTETMKYIDQLDKVCVVIDMEGFKVCKKFVVRELGWCDYRGVECEAFQYRPKLPFSALTPQDQRAARYLKRSVHGLSYYPRTWEAHEVDDVCKDVVNVYMRHKSQQRQYVGYKGGHYEKDLLRNLHIPSFNLELAGCPRFDQMPRLCTMASCGEHVDPVKHHCAKVECYHFVQWVRAQRSLKYDCNFVNIERLNRFV